MTRCGRRISRPDMPEVFDGVGADALDLHRDREVARACPRTSRIRREQVGTRHALAAPTSQGKYLPRSPAEDAMFSYGLPERRGGS